MITETKSWLIAYLEFNNTFNKHELVIDLPPFPMTLSPKIQNKIAICFTPFVEINTVLQFSLKLKDASTAKETEQIENIEINFMMPKIYCLTSEGHDCGVTFPPTQENQILEKVAILLTDCSQDLSLEFSVIEGGSMFSITEVREIKRDELEMNLNETYVGEESRSNVTLNRSGARLSTGGAVKLVCSFTAPKLSELQLGK